jgi:hypothetical protein
LGCIPNVRARTSSGGCNEELNGWCRMFNAALQSLVLGFISTRPDALVSFADPYPVIDNIIRDAPSENGKV